MILDRIKHVYSNERTLARFGVTLAANLLRAVFSFGSGVLTARGLGAGHYGDFTFLLASFGAIGQLTDMGSANAFFTFLSHRTRSLKFFSVYAGWLAVQFVVTIALITFILPASMVQKIWVGHERGIILVAFLASFLASDAWAMISQMGEARRKTALVQGAAVLQAALHLALIALASHQHWLTVKSVFLFISGEYALLLWIYSAKVLRLNLSKPTESPESTRVIVKEFASYCKPLIALAWASFAFNFADRWLLQRYGGSVQQGYYSVALQFAGVTAIVTNSILQVFWKEFAEAHGQNDKKRMHYLCDSLVRGLYFACAWIGCFLIPYAREILTHTVGGSYEAASLCLILMLIYPIHQALGQIYSTALCAGQETKVYAKIGLVQMPVSILIGYLVLAPKSYAIPGLELGAVGLALKMIVLQVAVVNWEAYVVAKTNGWPFKYLYQVTVLGVLLGLAWIGKAAGTAFFHGASALDRPAAVLVGGLLYAATTAGLLYRFPPLLGLTREEVQRTVRGAAKFIGYEIAPVC